ncbi:MAG: P-II family nitrogen regulator [Ferrimicrobium sp.]
MVDDSWGLTRMARVEVVIEGEQQDAVSDLFTAAGATGFTAVSNVSGLGHSGYHEGRLLFNDRNALCLMIVVLPVERVQALADGLRRVFEQRPGVLMVSETWISRPEYFC